MDKIVCVGKNYAEHAKELGDAVPDKPVLFIKPPSALKVAAQKGERVSLRIPPETGALHHECEIVLKISRDGYRMSLGEAQTAICEVTLGLDMTLRDLQAKLKKQGHPWEVSKAFLDSAVVGPWIKTADFGQYLDTFFKLSLDGNLKQTGRASQMTLSPAECVAYISQHFPLKKGDLVFTGTPAGVGPVTAGQVAQLEWGPIQYQVTWTDFQS